MHIGVGVCSYMCVGVSAQVCPWVWRPEDNFSLGWNFAGELVGWSVNLMDLPVSASPPLRWYMHATTLNAFTWLLWTKLVPYTLYNWDISSAQISPFHSNYHVFKPRFLDTFLVRSYFLHVSVIWLLYFLKRLGIFSSHGDVLSLSPRKTWPLFSLLPS